MEILPPRKANYSRRRLPLTGVDQLIPLRPIKAMIGYNLFVQEYFQKQRTNPSGHRDLKSCAKEWKTLNPMQKAEYSTKCAGDKQRYEKEMEEWKTLREEVTENPTSPYSLFVKDFWAKEKANLSRLHFGDIFQRISQEWINDKTTDASDNSAVQNDAIQNHDVSAENFGIRFEEEPELFQNAPEIRTETFLHEEQGRLLQNDSENQKETQQRIAAKRSHEPCQNSEMQVKANADGRSTQIQRMLEMGERFYLPMIGGGAGGNHAKLDKKRNEQKIRKTLFKKRFEYRFKPRSVSGEGLVLKSDGKESETKIELVQAKQRKLGTTEDEIQSKEILEALESYEFYSYIS